VTRAEIIRWPRSPSPAVGAALTILWVCLDVLAGDWGDDRGGEPLAQPALGVGVPARPPVPDREPDGIKVVGDEVGAGPPRFRASAFSLSATFASFGVSFSSVAASHCCRSQASCQTAHHRPPSDRAGYTVTPRSSEMTSPPPRVDSRSVPVARTLARAGAPVFFACPAGRPAGSAATRLWGNCGDLCLRVGGLPAASGSSLFLALRRWEVWRLASGRWSGTGSNCRPSAFQVNRAKRCADLRKRTSLTSETALGGRCNIYASRT
jgi:hypothetical protein